MSRLYVVVTWEDHVYIVEAANEAQACVAVQGQYDPPLGDEDVSCEGPLSTFTANARGGAPQRLNF